MNLEPRRPGAFFIAVRNYWWTTSIAGLYFTLSFLLWGGSRASLVSASVFPATAAVGLALYYLRPSLSRRARMLLVLGHLALGEAVIVWQRAYLPISDYSLTGNTAERDIVIYLVSVLIVGAMSMFGGRVGALVGLALHFGFVFDLHEPMSFKWAFPVLISVAGIIVSSAFWRLDQAYRTLEELASHDQLTGLLNRHRLIPEYERMQQAARDGRRAMLIVAWDLDDLKDVNDTRGHAAGDGYIVGFARALAALVRRDTGRRNGDTAFRVGGDEFISLHLDAQDGEAVVQRVHEAFPAVSAGWVRCEALTPDQAMSQADAALYAHKAQRKGIAPRLVV